MRRMTKKTVVSATSLFLLSILLYSCAIVKVQKLQPSDLESMLDKSGVVIIDARRDKEWNESDVKIEGAVRENPDDVPSWAGKYRKDKLIVVYCA